MINNMNKKGVSPLVSWVLIVAFSVTMAFIIIPAMIDNIKNNVPEPDIKYCDDVRISVERVDKMIGGGSLLIELSNEGSFSIQKLTVGRITLDRGLQWCEYNDFDSATNGENPLTPGDSKIIFVEMDRGYSSDITLENFVLCGINPISAGDDDFVSIELIPWIKVEDELINCVDKKIVIDDPTVLNS